MKAALALGTCFLLVMVLQLATADASEPTATMLVDTNETPRYNGYGYSFSGAWRELKASFYWALIGIVCCCISFPCLYWNEGRAVTREIVLGKAQERAIAIGTVDAASKPNDEHTGQLIHFDGVPNCTSDVQYDSQLGVAANGTHAKNMTRKVEMYQYVTKSHTEERRTGKYDSGGKEEMEQVTVIDEPQLAWAPVDGMPTQPELPNGWENRRHEFNNNHPCDFGCERFQRGVVLMGPYFLTAGMVNSEMRTVDKPLVPDVDTIMGFVRTGGEEFEKTLTSADPPTYDAAVADAKTDTSAPEADEHTKLLTEEGSGSGSGSGSGYGSGSGKAPRTLSNSSQEYLEQTKLTVNSDNILYMGDSPSNPRHHDYKVSWTSHHLPTETNGSVCVHTILAAQRRKNDGSFGLKAWTPEDVEEFHVDSCCQAVCCIGYAVVEGGAIDAIDRVCFPNSSSDSNQEDTDIESAAAPTQVEEVGIRSNNRAVSKLIEGQHSINDIIRALDAENTAKTKLYRYLGFFLMFLGFQFTMGPFPAVFSFFPWVGHAVGFILHIALFIVALTLACFGSITTVSVAWLRYRPLWGILGIAVSGGIACAVIFYKP